MSLPLQSAATTGPAPTAKEPAPTPWPVAINPVDDPLAGRKRGPEEQASGIQQTRVSREGKGLKARWDEFMRGEFKEAAEVQSLNIDWCFKEEHVAMSEVFVAQIEAMKSDNSKTNHDDRSADTLTRKTVDSLKLQNSSTDKCRSAAKRVGTSQRSGCLPSTCSVPAFPD